MKVIDISAWQENIDWNAVVNDDVEGVIIKLGEDYELDELFIEHVNNAVAAGLPYGVYYYSHATNILEARRKHCGLINRLRSILMAEILSWVFGMMPRIERCWLVM